MLLSADSEHPQRLIDTNKARSNSVFTYALGTLVLWQTSNTSRQDDIPDISTVNADSLTHARLIALASPRHAPYGRAAQEALQALGLWQGLMDSQRLAIAESVGQAWHYAASGNADLAFVALSQVKAVADKDGGQVSYWPVPAELYSPIVQQGVILAGSQQVPLARRFRSWLQTEPWVRAAITEAGYRLPPTGQEDPRD